MKVILKSDIINVGRQGEIKEVSPGFARNYLVPQNLVMKAGTQNMKIWERERVRFEKQREEVISLAREVALKMEAFKFTAKVKIGENGKIFGSINTVNIAKICRDNGFKVNKRDILLSNNIKETGSYELNIRLHPEVVAKIKFSVISEKE